MTVTPFNGGVGLRWVPVVGASGYVVMQSSNGGQEVEVVTTPNTCFNVMNLRNSTQYSFRVTPYQNLANGAAQQMVEYQFSGTAVPADIGKPQVTYRTDSDNAYFSWLPVIGASGYIVAMKPANKSEYESRYEMADLQITYNHLDRGVEYLYVNQPYTYINGQMIKSENYVKINFVP